MPKNPLLDVITPLLATAAAAALMVLALAQARAADAPHPGHDATHFYGTWMQPDAPHVSCCHDQDCAPAASRYVDGHWEARWSDDDEWVVIPHHKVDETRDTPDGRAHMCGRRVVLGGFSVFCFIRGGGA